MLGAFAISQILDGMGSSWSEIDEKLMFQVQWIIRLMSSLTPQLIWSDDKASPFIKFAAICFLFYGQLSVDLWIRKDNKTQLCWDGHNSFDIITVWHIKHKRKGDHKLENEW